jgi:hypothetical protein
MKKEHALLSEVVKRFRHIAVAISSPELQTAIHEAIHPPTGYQWLHEDGRLERLEEDAANQRTASIRALEENIGQVFVRNNDNYF